MLAAGALVLAACGSTSSGAASAPRPPAPVNVTVYIDNSRVSASPSSLGGGPVTFIITNQASRAESLAIRGGGADAGSGALADTGPINPQATAQVTVDLNSRGTYSLDVGGGAIPSIRAASLHIGAPRPSSNDQLLQP